MDTYLLFDSHLEEPIGIYSSKLKCFEAIYDVLKKELKNGQISQTDFDISNDIVGDNFTITKFKLDTNLSKNEEVPGSVDEVKQVIRELKINNLQNIK